jgi:hypothetical protein
MTSGGAISWRSAADAGPASGGPIMEVGKKMPGQHCLKRWQRGELA